MNRGDRTFVKLDGMKGIKSVILVGLACCLAVTSGLAREISSHSKSTRTEKSARSSKSKKSTASSKSRKSKARAETAKARKARASDEARYAAAVADLPPEDLPEPEIGPETDLEARIP